MRLKIVSMFSSLKCEHALVKRQNFQLIRATYAFLDEKQMCLPGKESMLMKSSHNHNEILDVSILFLNDHLEETLGPTKIEENHSKCINLTRVSVSS